MTKIIIPLYHARHPGILIAIIVILLSAVSAVQAQLPFSNKDFPAGIGAGDSAGRLLTSNDESTSFGSSEPIVGEDLDLEPLESDDNSNDGSPGSNAHSGRHRRDRDTDAAIFLSFFVGMTGLIRENTFITRSLPTGTYPPRKEINGGTTSMQGGISIPGGSDTMPGMNNPNLPTGETNPDNGAGNMVTTPGGDSSARGSGVSSVPEPGSAAMLVGFGVAGSLFAICVRRRR